MARKKGKRLEKSPEAALAISAWRTDLVRWRQNSGRARSAVVKDIGITVQNLASIEKGNSNPSLKVYLALCKKMRTRPQDIFNS